MIKKLTLILILLCSCGKEQEYIRIDKEFIPYYNSFIEDGKQRNKILNPKFLIIEFGNLQPKYAGICYMPVRVIIDSIIWKQSTETRKKMLIYHELGHCLLYRLHDDKIEERSGYPQSIMNTYLFNEAIFKYYEKDYIDELFGVKNEAITTR
jgi:hypothetical protein